MKAVHRNIAVKIKNLCIKSAAPVDGRRDGRDGVELGLGLAAADDDHVTVILAQEAGLGGPPPQPPFTLNRVQTV